MQPPLWPQLLLQVILIAINAYFAATEIAVISLNEAVIRHQAEEGDKKATRLLHIVEQPTGFLSTIQIGITLAGFLGSAFAADNLAGRLSRFPVYEEDADDIIGILNTRDWLLNARKASPRPVRELLRPAYFVPESVRTDKLFRDMQSRKIHLSIVVDEYGGTAGLVTMEDLLEEIVGNIYDEFDPQEDQEIIALGDNRWRIAGSAELDDVAEALDMEFPEDEESETLGGLVFAQLNVIPEDGSHPEVELYGLHIRVEELTDRRVEWATVTKLAPSEPKENAES